MFITFLLLFSLMKLIQGQTLISKSLFLNFNIKQDHIWTNYNVVHLI